MAVLRIFIFYVETTICLSRIQCEEEYVPQYMNMEHTTYMQLQQQQQQERSEDRRELMSVDIKSTYVCSLPSFVFVRNTLDHQLSSIQCLCM